MPDMAKVPHDDHCHHSGRNSRSTKGPPGGLRRAGCELLAQNGVDHRITPGSAREQVPADGAFLDHPGRVHGPGGRLVQRAPRTPDPVQAEFPESELLKEPDSLQALPCPQWSGLSAKPIWPLSCSPVASRADPISSPSLPATASAYSVLGSAVADFIAALMMPSTCSVVLGSKLRWRVASSLP